MGTSARLAVLGVAIATAATVTATAAYAKPPTDTSALREAVTAKGIFAHEQAFQDIADAGDGSRAGGTAGYDRSADYVADLLADAGYQVSRQVFQYDVFFETADPAFERVSPDARTYAPGDDFLTMEYSGSGDVTAPVQAVDVVLPPGAEANTSTSGCEAEDFAGFTEGNVALIQRGSCTFRLKAENADAAGASAVLIFNEGQEGRTDTLAGTLSAPLVSLPVLGTSFAVGEELHQLSQSGETTVHVVTQTGSERVTTENVIADTPTGREDRTVVVGAHLDSVPAGPGINDNGSGSGTILEIALQMAELGIEPTNRVRFAFWGAEESGLIGSTHYVDQLSKDALKDIALNLNFDMVASPNYVRFVYDGDGSAFGLKGPAGSATIEQVFNDFFASEGLESAPTEFSGRSDYQAFINNKIPAGGLFTGAEGEKTEEQAQVYGGVAGEQYDPCYHQPCDSMTPVADGADADLYAQLAEDYDLEGNVNMNALEEMSDAAAHATLVFAMTNSSPGGAKSGGQSEGEATFTGHQLGR